MALATEASNRVWQKVKTALVGANPGNQNAFLELKKYLATQGKNKDLQFIPFAAEDIIVDGGAPILDIPDGPYTLYGVYVKGRRTSATTKAFFALHDEDTNGATTTTLVTAMFNLTGQEYAFLFPGGLIGAADLTASSATAVGGATESTAALSCDGFVIVGA